ncbi:helix-turn-helix domain-containing protein [uncultured Maricaulis sp.]|uniref:winged helix-turn-helix transcriptional regulator n=1 Tax=uncultured Maricaulis sp. TaxID=174710 RepID=UPI0030DBD08F|tara:strand:- start:146816 stop:147298 length:483 start_codon:yes stop_codon:yes gene_type:complete
MGRKRFDEMPCAIAQTLNQVGDWWTLLIVRDAMKGARRFSDFHDSTGIAKNILTDRLNKLVENKIMAREEVGVRGHRQEYILTERGEALFPILIAMQQWGDCWVYGNNDMPVELVDTRTGERLAPLTVSNESGELVSHHDIGAREPCEPANERAANEGRR